MKFNKHSNLEGLHAFLGASKYHWINYDEDKLSESYLKYLAVERGTRLHEFAKECISLGIKLPRNKETLNQYVNDAIGYRMTPEQPLFYSENCFGTADSICFRNDFLRIHDLKTGVSPTSTNQLKVYSALFCLEYDYKPDDIDIELRIYQSGDIVTEVPKSDDIMEIMDKIVVFDRKIEELKKETEG